MTPKEAIKEFKVRITLAENEGYADTIPEYIEAMNMAISALEKQEPMKPMAPELDHLGGVTHPCGNCGGELVSKFHDFCPWCGQAVNWEK